MTGTQPIDLGCIMRCSLCERRCNGQVGHPLFGSYAEHDCMQDHDVVVKKHARQTWAETWMSIARTVAARSYDERLQVGAIIVPADNTGVLALGYNGNYKGGPNEAESLEPGMSGNIHAEQNAIIKCPFHYPVAKQMYVTHSPCRQCAKLIINADIRNVCYGELYRDTSGIELLKSAGVGVYSVEQAILMAGAR